MESLLKFKLIGMWENGGLRCVYLKWMVEIKGSLMIGFQIIGMWEIWRVEMCCKGMDG